MQITFESYEEMMEFVGKIQKSIPEEKKVPEKSLTYGEQIAPHFPDAHTSRVPVKQPVQQAPVQSEAPVQQTPVPLAPVQNAAPAAPAQQPAVPTSARTYTLDELAGAAMTLMDKGMQVQLQELLAGYGVDALPMLPAEQYGNFATALRGMGAQI